jgi:SPRY domain
MLVCNVSQRARRAAIAAGIVETALAADSPGTGNIVFAALVDDPASVGEIVDAYLGQVMVEMASADAAVDASLPSTSTVDVIEAATAAETANGTVVPAFTAATWDPATATAVTLSGGNLVVTSTTSSGDQGARGANAVGKTSGKYYFEVTLTTETSGGNTGFGIGTTASTYTAMGNNATAGGQVYLNGGIYANGSNSGFAVANPVNGHVIGVAVDLTAHKIWFRNHNNPDPGGAGGVGTGWNGIAAASPPYAQDPNTGAGGITIPSGTIVPFCTFNASGNVFTANFGASAFAFTVPSGFTSGWPV